jgi:two-component system chemotaxis sensor kinase CheA
MSNMDEVLAEFITEGEEILHRVSDLLQKIENSGSSVESISAIYRDVHTLKGNSQLFGFQKIALLSHVMEAVLDPIRKLNTAASPKLIESCFLSLDLLFRMMKGVRNGESEASFENEMVLRVAQLIEASSRQFGTSFSLNRDLPVMIDEPGNNTQPAASFDADASMSETSHEEFDSDLITTTEIESHPVEPLEENTKPIEIPVEPTIISKPEVKQVIRQTPQKPVPQYADTQSNTIAPLPPTTQSIVAASTENAINSPVDTSIRVPVALLDKLMNLVGELVLVRNQFLQYRNKHEDSELMGLSKNLDVVTSDLQSEVMLTRMQPIGSVLTKFQRMVRDIAKELKKKVDLTLEGAETELDKTLLEAIKDPITHLVRNACDHGIEYPEERIKVGKPDNGHLLIRSYHEGGQVVIEISDDGRGLDTKKILAKAIEKGIVTAEAGNRMQEREIFNLIFFPGFTTAKQVTSVSGRGVGMDVVKTNIAKVGGTVELSSITGKSTTIRLKIPLTLAIVPAMMVKSGKDQFAIPQVKLVQLVRIDRNDPTYKIEYLQGSPMFRLREMLLPLINLRDVISGKKTSIDDQTINVVVLSVEKEYFGLVVDEILDTTDIVVKPLGSFLKHLIMLSGATILGDGSISLILDVTGIANHCKINTKKNLTDEQHLKAIELKKAQSDSQEFLIFNLGTGVNHAIPLCLINRLEEFKTKDFEFTGNQKVIRYRDSILPILNLKGILEYEKKSGISLSDKEKTPVLVIQRSGKLFGLEVNDIVDIVTINQQIDDSIRDRPGILGNLIHQKSVIVVVDALGIIESVMTGKPVSSTKAIEEIKIMNREMKNKRPRVLFADDVVFFRRHVSKVLTDAGYDVTLAEDGKKALDILESTSDVNYSLIISDIEMPNMNGLEFARELRKRQKFKNTPLIALTTRFRDKDIDEGKKAGFNVYLEKLNPEKLVTEVSAMIGGQQT